MVRFASTARLLTIGSVVAVVLAAGPGAQAEGSSREAIAGTRVPAPTVPLADHKAVYRVTLLKATGTKSPTSARGRVDYTFDGSSCSGYSQTFRQITEMQPAEGDTRLSDMRSATFEDADGKGFSFDIKTSVDRNPPDLVDGRAEHENGNVLAIRLSKPASQTVDVDKTVLFPTAHLQRILAAARAGQHIVEVKVFDGSDNGKKVYDTTTVIGRPLTGASDDAGAAHVVAMDSMTRWPVVISYFEDGQKDHEPAYTLGFELYENGVSRALRFDYGDFVLAGEMVSLELRPGTPCR